VIVAITDFPFLDLIKNTKDGGKDIEKKKEERSHLQLVIGPNSLQMAWRSSRLLDNGKLWI
jgi:hypothetical protein